MLEDEQKVGDLELLRHAQGGNENALNEVLLKHRDRLKRMVSVRMNQKLQSRIDASDVIQETFIEAARALDAYLENPKLPVFIWLRHLTGQKLIQAHRVHLGSQKRAANREQRIFGGAPQATSESIAMQLAGDFTSPSQAALKNEARDQLLAALDSMDEIDREILTLRHFEQLSSRETAEIVGMNHEAVRKRYVRALDKMQKIMAVPP